MEKVDYTAWVDVAEAGTNRHSSNCGYVVQYSVQWKNFYGTYLSVPTMVNWKWDPVTETGSHAFWIYSDDTTMVEYDRQSFTIELTGSTLVTD